MKDSACNDIPMPSLGALKVLAAGEHSARVEEQGVRFVTKREVAQAVSVLCRCIDNWMRANRIPYMRLSARCTRFHLPSVLTALRKFEVKESAYHRGSLVAGSS